MNFKTKCNSCSWSFESENILLTAIATLKHAVEVKELDAMFTTEVETD